MKKLSKNFQQNTKTVEVMSGACAMYGRCSCSAVMDCGCGSNTKLAQSQFVTQGTYYLQSFERSDF